RRRLVLVTQEAAKQQPREICLRGGPVRRIAHVTGKMFRDDASAAREQDECAAEVLPTLVLVRFFDKRLFRGGEAREQEGKPCQLDARLEVQLLHGFPFGIRQLFDRIQLEEHVFVAAASYWNGPLCGKFHMLATVAASGVRYWRACGAAANPARASISGKKCSPSSRSGSAPAAGS